jgi:hypothetical protein
LTKLPANSAINSPQQNPDYGQGKRILILNQNVITHFNHFRESKLQNPHSERLQGIVLTFQAFYQERDREIPAQVQPSELANDFTFPRVIEVG